MDLTTLLDINVVAPIAVGLAFVAAYLADAWLNRKR
ncbi:hypothetical protein GR11A_00091 [Vibrio phage vB_VcorM_GR11A]|nr:hypothetical protein GR11A_00091 [Vibrio phage vB_VcorM_GR11A]